MSDRFEKHARTVTLLTLVSRVTGLARDAALARIFGISPVMDAFWFAFAIPNLFRRLFGEGALSAAFLPQYTQLDRDNPAIARQLATLTVGLMIIVLGGITLVGETVLVILSMTRADEALWIKLAMVMLPYMPMVCLVAILGAMLQVHGRFGPTATAPIVLNLFIIAAAIGGDFALRALETEARGDTHIMFVALSVLLAGIVQVTWSVLALRKWKWWAGRLQNCREAFAPMKKVILLALPMFLGLGVLQINTFMDDLIASYPTIIGPTIFGIDFPLLPGALTAINNAQRLHEFPLGVFGIAVATAIFPTLSRAAGDPVMFVDILRRGLRLVMYIGLPASAGLILVREPLTAAVFQGGDFTPADTARVARVLMGFAPAIWAYSMTHTLTRAFYARGDAMTPVKVAVCMVALNFVLNITLIWTPLKEAGLAWSTALCAMVQTVILLRLVRKHAPHLVDRAVVVSWIRTAIVTALMCAAVWGSAAVLTPVPRVAHTWQWAITELGILVSIGATVVVIASVALRMPELRWAMGSRGRGE